MWIYHIPYHPQASGKIERYDGLSRGLGNRAWKHWEANVAEATWLVNTRRSANRAGPAQTKPLHTVGGDKVPVLHTGKWLRRSVWHSPPMGKGKPINGIVFAQGPGCTWWAMQKDGETWCVPQGDLTLGEK